MSSGEYQQEAKSSVKISMNAKGEAQVEVKAYDGVDATELERVRQLAVTTYNATARDVRVQVGQDLPARHSS